jgi:hypothetical protein
MNDTRSQEARAQRAAKRVGLKARKSRWRAGSVDSFGEFMIIEPRGNYVVAGSRFDCTADDVVEFCSKHEVAVDRKRKKGALQMAGCLRFDAQDKRALRALDDTFTISADCETARITGEMEVEVVRPADDDGGARLRLTLKFPSGSARSVVGTARH